MKFEVVDADDKKGKDFDFLGSVETTVSKLFGARNQTSIMNLNTCGKIIIKVDTDN